MIKFLVLGLFLLLQGVKGDVVDEAQPANKDLLSQALIGEMAGKSTFYASQQFFYLQNPFPWRRSIGLASNMHDIGKELDADYVVTIGIGAHKIHTRKLSWNKARRVCIDEGGHLAVIRSDSEEKIILQMMLEKSLDELWVGYHDLFAEGDWSSVLDEPLATTGWARWSKHFPRNPDNYANQQHCARLIKQHGMDDECCTYEKPFICKI